MTIKRKVEKIDVIERGLDVPSDEVIRSKKQVLLQIPIWLLDQIDECVQKRAGMTRTGWMLEAAQEKIERSLHNESLSRS